MAEFIFSYRSPADYQPGSGDVASAWRAWFGELGGQLTELGKPVFSRATTGDCGDGTNLGGYSLITAENLQEAQALAKGCPILAAGGGVEIGELSPIS